MRAAGNLTLYLGYATAIATFSAAAVAMGLLYCHNRRQRATSIAILLLAMLGIASALIAVAKQHTNAPLNAMVFLGFGATAGYVLFSALTMIFAEPRTALMSDHPLAAHRTAGASMRPVVAFGAFAACLLGLFLAATPSLFDSFFRSRPLRPPSRSAGPPSPRPPPTYASICGDLPAQRAPEPQRGMLASLWLGSRGAGAITAGCPAAARRVGQSDVWWIEGLRGTELRSVGVAAPGQPPAIVFAPAASFVRARALDGSLRGATNRAAAGAGDLYLVDTTSGTFLLIRETIARRTRYVVLPPALTRLWLDRVRAAGWLWPRRTPSSPTGRGLAFLAQDDRLIATGTCTSGGACTMSSGGRVTQASSPAHVGLAEVLSVIP